MAQITSSAKMPKDADAKKLLGVSVNNSGTTEILPPQGGTEVTLAAGDRVAPLMVQLAAGTAAAGKLAANSGVDIGDVDVTSVVPGTTAASLGKAEDAAHTTGDVGVLMLAVRQDTYGTALAGTDGDYIPLNTDAAGDLRVKMLAQFAEDGQHTSGDKGLAMLAVRKDTLASNVSNDNDYANLLVDANGRLYVAGDTATVAHDAADAGNPAKIGGKALSAIPSAVSANDRVNAYFDLYGRQVVALQTISHEPPNEYSGRWYKADVAASGYGVGFENPTGSGKTYLVDQVWIASEEASVLSLMRATGYTGTQTTYQADDLRQASALPSCKVLTLTGSIGTATYINSLPYYAGEKVLHEYSGAIKVAEGQMLIVYKESGTTGDVWMNVMWREI